MNCNECIEKLSLYIDHMLNEEEEKALMAHLDLCETCRREYEALRDMVSWLGEIEEPTLPEDFHETLMERIKKEQKVVPMKAKPFKWHYPAGVVATFLVGFLVFSTSISKNSSARSETAQEPMAMAAPEEKSMALEGESKATTEDTKSDVAPQLAYAAESEVESRSQKDELHETGRAENNEQVTPRTWEVTITDEQVFLEALRGYLEEQQVNYTLEQGAVVITQEDDEALLAWLNAREEVNAVHVTKEAGSSLKLFYHQ